MALRKISNMANIIMFAGALLMGAIVAIWIFSSSFFASAGSDDTTKTFIIEKGANLHSVSKDLFSKGLLKNDYALPLLGRFQKGPDGEEMKIFPGEYKIAQSMSPKEILKVFAEKNVVYHELVIPEGFNLKEIAARMAKTTLCTKSEADIALRDRKILNKFSIDAQTSEGYIFPDTYKFSRPENAYDMVEKMIEEGKKVRTQKNLSRAAELGLTWHEVLTLASIIEKETGAAAERPQISSVFHNRLQQKMMLQTDPTVIYGIENFDGNLTKKHLQTPGPYNTYKNKGLTPTPIASPGKAAIEAALFPADTDFLYFVSKGDGTHKFSATYKEHVNAVNKFQKGKKTIALASTPKKKKKKVKKKVVPKITTTTKAKKRRKLKPSQLDF